VLSRESKKEFQLILQREKERIFMLIETSSELKQRRKCTMQKIEVEGEWVGLAIDSWTNSLSINPKFRSQGIERNGFATIRLEKVLSG
jgi:hypothetical protein